MERYERECKQLGLLAQNQLNLPKNVIKPDFEDMNIVDIFRKFYEELDELKSEILMDKNFIHIKKEINFHKTFSELGDTAACLAGLIAKLNRMKEEQNDDCA